MGNFLAAIFAIAELVLFHPDKRSLKTMNFGVPPNLLGFRHRLILKGIHSAKSTNCLLIQFHNRLSFLAGCGLRGQIAKALVDELPELLQFS
ncbi:hypothetical protein [Ruegeria conchae]|uniref:hypothetical protein n=1 Tax=Ruegeria conchae TaxID=981384 RepID=UPI0028835339|nr:hypothetical protein [Ruegeria conchae]